MDSIVVDIASSSVVLAGKGLHVRLGVKVADAQFRFPGTRVATEFDVVTDTASRQCGRSIHSCLLEFVIVAADCRKRLNGIVVPSTERGMIV
jgi:hypothetical protein